MVNCAKCGTQNRDDTKYCKNCGTKLSASSVISCSKCGASNVGSSLFCNRCGERLAQIPAPTTASKTTSAKQTAKTARGSSIAERAKTTTTITTKNPPPTVSSKTDSARTKDTPTAGALIDKVPDWLSRFYESTPSQTRLVPTHDLLRMANALGIDVDYSTLRFWQKRGLVPKPTRGRVSSGRGTRGYYDPSLIDRLSFIREIQKLYAMNLDAIRDELSQIESKLTQPGNSLAADPYKTRLAELEVQHDHEAKRTLATVLYKALGLEPGEIASITIQKIDGQTIQFLPDKFVSETVVAR